MPNGAWWRHRSTAMPRWVLQHWVWRRPLGGYRKWSGGSGPSGHDKSELGPAAGRAAHADGAAVGLDQALDDVQAQAGATAPLAPPELAEHARGDLGRDALALVADGDGGRYHVVYLGRLDHDGHDTSAVPNRVLHQVAEDLVDLVGVQPGLR